MALCYICAVGFNKCLRTKLTGNDIELLGLKDNEERNTTVTIKGVESKNGHKKGNEAYSEMMEYWYK